MVSKHPWERFIPGNRGKVASSAGFLGNLWLSRISGFPVGKCWNWVNESWNSLIYLGVLWKGKFILEEGLMMIVLVSIFRLVVEILIMTRWLIGKLGLTGWLGIVLSLWESINSFIIILLYLDDCMLIFVVYSFVSYIYIMFNQLCKFHCFCYFIYLLHLYNSLKESIM